MYSTSYFWQKLPDYLIPACDYFRSLSTGNHGQYHRLSTQEMTLTFFLPWDREWPQLWPRQSHNISLEANWHKDWRNWWGAYGARSSNVYFASPFNKPSSWRRKIDSILIHRVTSFANVLILWFKRDGDWSPSFQLLYKNIVYENFQLPESGGILDQAPKIHEKSTLTTTSELPNAYSDPPQAGILFQYLISWPVDHRGRRSQKTYTL